MFDFWHAPFHHTVLAVFCLILGICIISLFFLFSICCMTFLLFTQTVYLVLISLLFRRLNALTWIYLCIGLWWLRCAQEKWGRFFDYCTKTTLVLELKMEQQGLHMDLVSIKWILKPLSHILIDHSFF